MADKSIVDLPQLSEVTDATLIPVYQPNSDNPAQKMPSSVFRNWAEASAEQYVDGATNAAQRAEKALEQLGNDAQIAQQAAVSASADAKRAKLYADQTEASVSGVASFNGRGGHVVPQSGDYTADMVGAVPTNNNLPNGTDLNTVTTSGIYRFEVVVNAPTGVHYSQLLVMRGGGDTITQIVGAYSTGDLYTRSGSPSDVGGIGSWSAWKKLATTDTALLRDGSNAMTGNLVIERAYPAVLVKDTTAARGTRLSEYPHGQGGIENYKDDSNYRGIRINTEADDLTGALKLAQMLGGKWSEYNILHSGNVGNYAAPAGFGLGEVRGKMVADPKTISVSGYYYIDSANAVNCPTLIPNYPYGAIHAVVRGTQVSLHFVFDRYHAYMYWDGDATNAVWEYLNPPMALGVEYRTTERYLGKPVYAKLVSFGALPNSSRKSVEHGIVGIDHVCGVYAEAKYPNDTSLSMIGWGDITVCFATNTSVTVTTTADRSGYNGYFTLKYTKKAD